MRAMSSTASTTLSVGGDCAATELELDTAAPDAELLDDWLEQYYDGLLAAVAADMTRLIVALSAVEPVALAAE